MMMQMIVYDDLQGSSEEKIIYYGVFVTYQAAFRRASSAMPETASFGRNNNSFGNVIPSAAARVN